MNLVAPVLADLVHLCERLPVEERAQYLALGWAPEFDPVAAAMSVPLSAGPSHVFTDLDGTPYCAGGYAFIRPGVMQSWMIGTEHAWTHHRAEITAVSRAVIADLLTGGQVHRIQTLCLASRKVARRWYSRGLGLIEETQHRGYGRNGEDVCVYRLTPDELGAFHA